MAEVTLRSVVKRYTDELQVIHGVDLDIEDHEFAVFVGPSGCGKSTLLRMIAGLESISGGEIRIGGQRVNETAPGKRGVAMVFQNYALYPHMTVADNMAFGLRNIGTPEEEIRKRVQEAGQILQIEPLLERRPKDLSGGQRQRVAIGRAIVKHPRVFLFDEPLSNLDAALRVQMRIELTKLHQRLNATMIYVTHDQVEAMTMADKIVVLRAGRVEQVGAPIELYRFPQNQFVAGFIGSPKMNFLEAEVESVTAEGPVARVDDIRVPVGVDAGKARSGDRVTLGMRPEHLRPDPEDGPLRGEVELVEHLGDESLLYVRLDNGVNVVAEDSGESEVKSGDKVRLGLPPDYCHLFDAEGGAFPRRRRAAA